MRSILLRSFRTTLLLKSYQPVYRLSTTGPQGQKKNIFKLPLKHQFPTQALQATQDFINMSRSCKILAITLRDNMTLFTDTHLHHLYRHLERNNLTIDNSFHQIIAPISLEYLKVFTREHAVTMWQMAMTMLALKIDNQPLWDALLKKLDTENCYRYIPLYETSLLLNRLLDKEEYSKLGLTRKLIGVVHQQKQYYEHWTLTKPVIAEILGKVDKLKMEEPQLTEAYKQLK